METLSTEMSRSGKYFAILLLLIAGIYNNSCRTKINSNIVIQGDLLSSNSIMEGKKLYLGDNSTRLFIDSAVVKDGKFQFRIMPDKDFVPIRVSIVYATGNPKWPFQLVGYKNPYLAKTNESNFYADLGEMQLVRDTTLKVAGKDLVTFIIQNPNKQTEAAFRHLSFRKNPAGAADKRNYNVALVKKYPYSVDLLSELEFSKKDVTEKELAELISFFDPSLQNTTQRRKINSYLGYVNTTGDKFPENLSLKKSDNTFTSKILDPNAKYNLVVFWASWCGPCRMEIPRLKMLHNKHKDNVNIVSISTDRSTTAWKKALKQEDMPWDQFIVDEKTMAQLDKKYNLQSIPLTLLFDADNNLIEKKLGYNVEEEVIESIVEFHFLKNKIEITASQ